MFLATLTLCLKLALSKFARILPAETMLGRRGLQSLHGSCAACNRPFGRDPGPGDKRGANASDSSHNGGGGGSSSSQHDTDSILSRYSRASEAGGGSDGGSSVGSGVLRRENPFKQSQRSRHRGGGGNNVPRAGSLRPGELQLQTVGEWEDGISVSSISSSHPSDAPGPGSKESFAGGMNLPAV